MWLINSQWIYKKDKWIEFSMKRFAVYFIEQLITSLFSYSNKLCVKNCKFHNNGKCSMLPCRNAICDFDRQTIFKYKSTLILGHTFNLLFLYRWQTKKNNILFLTNSILLDLFNMAFLHSYYSVVDRMLRCVIR